MENKRKLVKTLGIIHTLMCSVYPIALLLLMYLSTLTSSANSDAAGVAILMILVMFIFVIGYILVLLVPFILFMISTAKRKCGILSIVSIIIADVLMSVEMYIQDLFIGGSSKQQPSVSLILCEIYIVISLVIITIIATYRKELKNEKAVQETFREDV